MELPVYLIAGFLDSGKTTFLNGILEDGFAHDAKTLLLCCEEGDVEYSEQALYNVTVVKVDEFETFSPEFLTAMEHKYQPQQIVIECNGMWSLPDLCNKRLPSNWLVYQVMVFVEAETFEIYSRNMSQLMMEKIMNADLLVFNRCTEELKAQLRSRNLRMVNRRADIFLEDDGEEAEDYINDQTPPFNMDGDVVTIPDEDFGIFYVDVMDYPERYAGKTIDLSLVMCHSKTFPNTFVPGRFAMTCCADDIEFLGVVATGDLAQFEDYQWLNVTATVSTVEHAAYQGKGPQLNILTAKVGDKPENDVVSF
ncbi:GTP-binding protein [Bengtsoniella intestinalis]|uniref:TIGR03943 family putative permease subunit n=1 Tax=Bengtsoniella intestinalis TaxID=3073143 RepID=UPI00391FC6BF